MQKLAGLSRRDGLDARRLLPHVLASLGYPITGDANPYDEAAWREYWDQIAWAQHAIDDCLAPYAAAQHVLQVAGEVPDLWQAAGDAALSALLADWNRRPARRPSLDDAIRAHLNSLSENDVPPRTGKSNTP